MGRIRGMFTDCIGWGCWECQAHGTPLLDRVGSPGVGFATGTPTSVGGLGVTFLRACKQSVRSDSEKNRARSSTGFRILWFENRRFSPSRDGFAVSNDLVSWCGTAAPSLRARSYRSLVGDSVAAFDYPATVHDHRDGHRVEIGELISAGGD